MPLVRPLLDTLLVIREYPSPELTADELAKFPRELPALEVGVLFCLKKLIYIDTTAIATTGSVALIFSKL